MDGLQGRAGGWRILPGEAFRPRSIRIGGQAMTGIDARRMADLLSTIAAMFDDEFQMRPFMFDDTPREDLEAEYKQFMKELNQEPDHTVVPICTQSSNVCLSKRI